MSINLYIWIVFGVITLLAIGFAVLNGFQRTGLQSGIRLIVLVITVILAAVITTSVLTASIDDIVVSVQEGVAAEDETFKEVVEILTGGSTAAEDIRQMLVAIVAPLMFFVIFLLLDILFLIVYAVVGAFTFSQGHLRRKARKHNTVYHASKPSRIVSMVLNFVISFAVAAFLIVPVTYYMPLSVEVVALVSSMQQSASAETTDTTSTDSDASSSTVTVSNGIFGTEYTVADLQTAANNPLLKIYGTLGGMVTQNLTNLKTSQGTVTLQQFIKGLQPILSSLSDLSNSGTDNLSSTQLYTVADKIDDNVFADEFMGSLLAQAATKWKDDEQFLGQDPIDFGSQQLNTSIYTTLEKQTTVSESFRAIGHIYSVVQVMQIVGTPSADSAQTSAQTMQALAENLTPESIQIVSDLVSGTIIGELGTSDSGISAVAADKISDAVSGLLTGLYEVKQNDPEKLEKETAAVATVFDTVNNAENLTKEDAKNVVEAVKDSTVLQDVLEEMVTDNDNPLNVEVTEETEEKIKQALNENDVEEGSKVYDIVASLFGFTTP